MLWNPIYFFLWEFSVSTHKSRELKHINGIEIYQRHLLRGWVNYHDPFKGLRSLMYIFKYINEHSIEHHHNCTEPCDTTIGCYPSTNMRLNLCTERHHVQRAIRHTRARCLSSCLSMYVMYLGILYTSRKWRRRRRE